MRVALVHYWLVGMRGGEKVLEQLCALFPDADIYTHVLDRASLSDQLKDRRIFTSSIQKLPLARRHYQKYVGFMPRALEELRLADYDLIISSESGPAKGIIPGPHATHLCYCHSPMRYIWDHYQDYAQNLNPIARAVFSRVAHGLRQWDVTTAARVDRFIANSHFVASRIQRYYRRDAHVIHPPVDVSAFSPRPGPHEAYLFLGELVSYKRADLAVEAFRGLDRRLIIAGDGEDRARLQRKAPRNVEFVGRVSFERLQALYASCRALIFPGQEDFGIVPVEAMASGRPVIAYGAGGALDSVRPGVTGLFFHEQTPEALRAAITQFEDNAAAFSPEAIARHAHGFSADRFRAQMMAAVEDERGRRSGRAA